MEMTTESLFLLASQLDDAAKDFHSKITLGTREQWNAWECVHDAARYLRSAAILLARVLEEPTDA